MGPIKIPFLTTGNPPPKRKPSSPRVYVDPYSVPHAVISADKSSRIPISRGKVRCTRDAFGINLTCNPVTKTDSNYVWAWIRSFWGDSAEYNHYNSQYSILEQSIHAPNLTPNTQINISQPENSKVVEITQASSLALPLTLGLDHILGINLIKGLSIKFLTTLGTITAADIGVNALVLGGIVLSVAGTTPTTFEKEHALIGFRPSADSTFDVYIIDDASDASATDAPTDAAAITPHFTDVKSAGDPNEPPEDPEWLRETKPDASPPQFNTWGQIIRIFFGKIRGAVESILKPNRWQRFRAWMKQAKTTPNGYKGIPKKRTSETWGTWIWRNLGRGFREYGMNHVKHWRTIARNAKLDSNSFTSSPLKHTLDTLNRPGKMFRYFSNILGLISTATTISRLSSDSKNTNPIGSELIPEKFKPYVEPILGVHQAGSIGAVWYHYLLGWGWESSLIYNGLFAGGAIVMQAETGGANIENVDYMRINGYTLSGIPWALLSVPYRITKAAFPGYRWGAYLLHLEQSGHPHLARALSTIPARIAPKRIPTLGNYAANLGLTLGYTAAILQPTTIWAEDTNATETYKAWSAQIPVELGLKWFELACDPYLRPGMGAVYALAQNAKIIIAAPYFQRYKGKKYYRENCHDLARENAAPKRAYSELARALGTKRLFNAKWQLEDTEWLDFFNDLNRGEFNPKEVDYFISLIKRPPENAEYENTRLGLLLTLASYSAQEVPFDWNDGPINAERIRRAEFYNNIVYQLQDDMHLLSQFTVQRPRGFLKRIAEINQGEYENCIPSP